MADDSQAFDAVADGTNDMKKVRPIVIAPRETPAKRRLRVLALRRRLENGTYRPDLHVVAERLISEMHFGSSWH